MKRLSIRVAESCTAAGDESPSPGSRFHTFPSLTRQSDGAFLCTALVGTEKSGCDGRIRVFKSTGGYRSWTPTPTPTAHDEAANPHWGYLMCHIAETAPGCLVAAYLRSDRSRPEEPLFHPTTNGMQHAAVRLSESQDNGCTWSPPRDLDYRLPDLIVPGRLLRLPDGTLAMPFEVWHEWDRGWRDGPSTRLIRSLDQGRTWPEAGTIARDPGRRLIYGDPRLTVLPDGRLVALLWVYDTETERDLPVHRAESSDGGRTWSSVHNTGLIAQITNPASLQSGLMIAVYQKRFGAQAGLRAVLSHDDGFTWDAGTDVSIWSTGHHSDESNPFSGYQDYAFGYSTVLRLTEREILVSFWVSNAATTYIRILKVVVE